MAFISLLTQCVAEFGRIIAFLVAIIIPIFMLTGFIEIPIDGVSLFIGIFFSTLAIIQVVLWQAKINQKYPEKNWLKIITVLLNFVWIYMSLEGIGMFQTSGEIIPNWIFISILGLILLGHIENFINIALFLTNNKNPD